MRPLTLHYVLLVFSPFARKIKGHIIGTDPGILNRSHIDIRCTRLDAYGKQAVLSDARDCGADMQHSGLLKVTSNRMRVQSVYYRWIRWEHDTG